MSKENSPQNILERSHDKSSVADSESHQFKLEQVRRGSRKAVSNKMNLIEHLMYFNIRRDFSQLGKMVGVELAIRK